MLPEDIKPKPGIIPFNNANSLAQELIPLTEFRKNLAGTKYLIKPYLEKGKIGVVYGESDSFKSFLKLDFGLSIATGEAFHGHSVHQGPVIYVLGEGAEGIARRVEAWLINKNMTKDTKDIPFFITKIPAELINKPNIIELSKIILDKCHEPPSLVVFDTLSTNFGVGNESSNDDVAIALNNVGVHIRDQTGACVCIVHHCGHSSKDRERGAYAIRANVDFRIYVERLPDNNGINVTNPKQKDRPGFEPISFIHKIIEIPGLVDSEGEQETSLVLEIQDYQEIPKPDRKGKNQQLAMVIIRNKLKEYKNNLDERGKNKTPYLTYSVWEQLFIAENPDIRKDSFKRTIDSLIDAGKVINSGGVYTLPDEAI